MSLEIKKASRPSGLPALRSTAICKKITKSDSGKAWFGHALDL